MTTNIRKELTEDQPRRQKQTYTLLHFNVLHKVPKVRLNLLRPTEWIHMKGFDYKAKPIGANPRFLLVEYKTENISDSVITGCTPFDMEVCIRAALSMIRSRI